jgi:HemY protein
MIRVVLFLGAMCLVALGAVWLAERPGEVAITWQGYQIETSVMILAAAVAAVAIASVVVWSILRLLLLSPGMAARALARRQRRKGRLAITQGLLAIGAGDAVAAARHDREAHRIAANDPLALLLRAQTAQISRDQAAAEAAFRAMAQRPETRLLGLHGLYIEARRRADAASARRLAEEAAQAAPTLPWAGQAVLELRCSEADWEGALAILDANRQHGLIDKATYHRHGAVLLTARALMLEESDPGAAKMLAIEATRCAPDLVPAAALAGRLLGESGDPRWAGKIVQAAWRKQPHPELAETYAHLRPDDFARDRLSRVRTLVREPEAHPEGLLALARAALDAHEFTLARETLGPLLAQPTQRAATLMAELEEVEHGDVGRSREWLARAVRAARDPAWTADGFVSERWLPVSPVTGRIDAFEWRVPIEQIAGAALETRAEPAQSIVPSKPAPIAAVAPVSADSTAFAEPVITLAHPPDDPGPEHRPRSNGWRLGSLFR